MLYQIKGGRVMFAADTILEHVDFEVRNRNEKIAVVGRNGAGKTTLLKVITGEVELTKVDGEDSSITSTNPTIGYLRQITFDDLSVTLDTEIRKVFADIIKEKERIDELVTLMDNAEGDEAERLAREYTALMDDFKDRGGYYYEKEYDAMLTSFGFTLSDKEKKLAEFSGGQLTKLAFIKLLLSKPDILLLDEPTNHLDMRTIEWLEGYLQNYNRALVIVSHDRMFIDRIANVVYEITYGQVTRFSGNYSDYVRQKKERYEKQ
ncbi:MAG: ABC-F family ATP-binding cassette domain-containing protein, partial [Lachnospiraceae bacterium]|nr:ABC-F family ATP-binding cassette domain-containing protein [Lachnospiraceae bacterium]